MEFGGYGSALLGEAIRGARFISGGSKSNEVEGRTDEEEAERDHGARYEYEPERALKSCAGLLKSAAERFIAATYGSTPTISS